MISWLNQTNTCFLPHFLSFYRSHIPQSLMPPFFSLLNWKFQCLGASDLEKESWYYSKSCSHKFQPQQSLIFGNSNQRLDKTVFVDPQENKWVLIGFVNPKIEISEQNFDDSDGFEYVTKSQIFLENKGIYRTNSEIRWRNKGIEYGRSEVRLKRSIFQGCIAF